VNDFLHFMGQGMEIAGAIFGQEEFRIGRYTFCGDVDLFDSEKELMTDGGGFVGTYNATIVAGREQFGGKFAQPIERALDGKRLMIQGRKYRIVKAMQDAISMTLHLANPSKSK
jgi:hypothetical protein